jgi:hypothetical protein
MRLVIELDDLVVVGHAVENHKPAFAAVQRLIAGAPSLTDVMGKASNDPAPIPTPDLLLSLLSDGEWHITREVTDAASVEMCTGLNHLKRLAASGVVESRQGARRSYEWRKLS